MSAAFITLSLVALAVAWALARAEARQTHMRERALARMLGRRS